MLWDPSAAFGSERSVDLGFCSPRTFPYSGGALPQRFRRRMCSTRLADSHAWRTTTESCGYAKPISAEDDSHGG